MDVCVVVGKHQLVTPKSDEVHFCADRDEKSEKVWAEIPGDRGDTPPLIWRGGHNVKCLPYFKQNSIQHSPKRLQSDFV